MLCAYHFYRRILACALLVGVCLNLPACVSKQHAEQVNQANDRWLQARSGIMLQTGMEYFRSGDLRQAESTTAEALRYDPKNPGLHTLAGRIELEHDRLERAYHRFSAAIELDPEFHEAYYYRAIVLQRWQRFDAALEGYQKAFELLADNLDYLLAIAEMHVAMNESDKAIELLESKKIYFDQNSGIRLALGQLYAMNNNFDKAITSYTEASMLQPGDLQIIQELAYLQLADGQVAAATESFERLCAAPQNADRLDLNMSLAQCYMRTGRTDHARQLYIQLMNKYPQNADIWVKLGEISWSQQDYTGTLTAANRIISIAPQRHEGYLLSGMVWHKRGNTDQALTMFERAANAAPYNALPVILRGMALEQAGRTQEAAAAYTEALRRQPDDVRAKRLLASVQQTFE